MPRDELILKMLHREPKQLSNNSCWMEVRVAWKANAVRAGPVTPTAHYKHLWHSGHRSMIGLNAGQQAGRSRELMLQKDPLPQLPHT